MSGEFLVDAEVVPRYEPAIYDVPVSAAEGVGGVSAEAGGEAITTSGGAALAAELLSELGVTLTPGQVALIDESCGPHVLAELELSGVFDPGSADRRALAEGLRMTVVERLERHGSGL